MIIDWLKHSCFLALTILVHIVLVSTGMIDEAVTGIATFWKLVRQPSVVTAELQFGLFLILLTLFGAWEVWRGLKQRPIPLIQLFPIWAAISMFVHFVMVLCYSMVAAVEPFDIPPEAWIPRLQYLLGMSFCSMFCCLATRTYFPAELRDDD